MTRQDTGNLNAVDGLTVDGDGTVEVEHCDEHQALSSDDDTGALRSCSQAMSAIPASRCSFSSEAPTTVQRLSPQS
jgi:hypothetical protein